MSENVYRRIASATASGDVEGLAALAMELASEVAGLESIRDADLARKAAQASRKKRLRLGMSRDVPGQDATGEDVSPSPLPSSFPTPHITTSFPPSPSPRLSSRTRTIRVVQPPVPEVLAVTEHYVATHPKRRPGPKDHAAIVKALAWGYSVSDLCEAITGNAADEWHRGKKKHSLTYVLRSNGEIDDFRDKAVQPAMWDYENECLTPYGERVTRPDAA